MQPQPTFDTHAFVKRLTGAGMPESQAEILAKGQFDLVLLQGAQQKAASGHGRAGRAGQGCDGTRHTGRL